MRDRTPEEIAAAIDDGREERILALLFVLETTTKGLGREYLHEFGFDIDAEIAAWVEDFAARQVGFIDETTKAAVADAVEAARASNADPVDALNTLFALFLGARLKTIATTVANGVMNAVYVIGGKKAGRTHKVWITRGDERVRGLHVPMDGQIRPIVENFEAPNGEQGMQPGAFQSAAMNAGCRCIAIPFVTDKGISVSQGDPEIAGAQHDAQIDAVARWLSTIFEGFFSQQLKAALQAAQTQVP